MNKKIISTVLFAVAALFTQVASAVTYDNSVTDLGGEYAQTANARVAPNGPSVRANDLIVIAQTGGVSADIPSGAQLIVRLPAGLYFDGNPSFLVTTAGANPDGLTLIGSGPSGDPTRGEPGTDQPAIALNDEDGDGFNDRAVVTIAAAGKAGDKIYISSNIKASSAAVVGNNKKASVIVNQGLANVQNIADVVAENAEPVQGGTTTQLTSAQSSGQLNVPTLTPTILVTIPSGTLGSQTITIAKGSGVNWSTGAAGTTATILNVRSPVAAAPLAFVNGVATATNTQTINLVTPGSGPLSGAKMDVQVEIRLDAVDATAGATGARGVAIAGTAGLTGNANLINVLANGSSAKLSSATGPGAVPGNKVIDIVKGSNALQTLPAIDVTENFTLDAVDPVGGTATLTITAGTGLRFAPTGSQTVTVTGGTTASVTVSGVNSNVLTIGFATRTAASKLVRITGILATATSTASGNLSVTVGGATDEATAPKESVVVANAVDVGTVSAVLGGSKKKAITGPTGAAGAVTSTITLTESTYGSLTTAAQSQVENAHFKVTPSTGSTIVAITVTANLYPATPPAANCSPENVPGSIAWICLVTAESTALTAGTSTISVAINYYGNAPSVLPGAKPAAVVGSVISMALSGNAGLSGSVDVADVVISTSLSRGPVPDLTPGDTEAQNMAKLTITEKFAGAIGPSGGNFRLIAPTGVTFNNAGSVVTSSSPATAITATPTITATFAPNDTLVINVAAATGVISFTPQAVVAPSASGFLTFQVVNGDINGAVGVNITAESINLGYADGTLDPLKADDTDIDLVAGFQALVTITGGLKDYKAPTSSASTVATAQLLGDDTLVITAKAVGNATITVTDQLDQPETIDVTVTAGAAQPSAPKINVLGGGDTDATITGGASSDAGATYDDEFTTADDVTLVATLNVDPDDQGLDGEVYAISRSTTPGGAQVWYVLNEDGQLETFNPLDLSTMVPHIVATPLADVYNITVFSGNLAAGTHRVAVGYFNGSTIIYAGKVILITVTE